MRTLASKAATPNPHFEDRPRKARQNNVEWLKEHVLQGRPAVVLLGGTNVVDFRLRVAQSRLRADLTPSHWSHCLLIPKTDGFSADTEVVEISLTPAGGFGYPPPINGVQRAKIASYASAKRWPNVAAIHPPEEITADSLLACIERFERQRVVFDSLQLLLAWLAYVWGVGEGRNPLQEGIGMPSAGMLEMLFGAENFDLTPGLESRSSCPEAIWQSARWWHDYHDNDRGGALSGAFNTQHYLFEELDK